MQPPQIWWFTYSWCPTYGQYESFTYSCNVDELTTLDPDLPDHFQLGTRAIPRSTRLANTYSRKLILDRQSNTSEGGTGPLYAPQDWRDNLVSRAPEHLMLILAYLKGDL